MQHLLNTPEDVGMFFNLTDQRKRHVLVYFGHLTDIEIKEYLDVCENNNWKKPCFELRILSRWLKKFDVDTSSMSVDVIVEYIKKRLNRTEQLKQQGRSQSITDLSLYELYAPSKEIALQEWNNTNNTKSIISKKHASDNPDIRKSGTLEYQINRYGVEEGTKRYQEMCQKKKEGSATSLDHWIKKGYSYDDAVEMRRRRQQTFSLQKCIEKYGKEKGIEIFNKRQEKWQNTLKSKPEEERIIISLKKNTFSIEGWMLRGYTEQEAQGIVKERFNRSSSKYFSDEAVRFFEDNFSLTSGWLYGTSEWFIWDHDHSRHYFYDFTHIDKKIIIEYHGQAFHPNKEKLNVDEWKNWRQPFSDKTADEAQSFDVYKKQLAEYHGFKVFEIFSNDDPVKTQNTITEITNYFL